MYAGCFSVSIIHQTLTWTTGSFTCPQMLMHAVAHGGWGGGTDTRKTVCTESWLWNQKNTLPYRGIEPALAACRSAALPTEPHPHPHPSQLKPWASLNVGWGNSVCNRFPTRAHTDKHTSAVLFATPAAALRLRGSESLSCHEDHYSSKQVILT